MQYIATNWKTSSAGLALLLLAVLHSVFGVNVAGVPLPDLSPATLAMVYGLLVAKDGNVSGNGALAMTRAVFTPEHLAPLMQAAKIIIDAAEAQKPVTRDPQKGGK